MPVNSNVLNENLAREKTAIIWTVKSQILSQKQSLAFPVQLAGYAEVKIDFLILPLQCLPPHTLDLLLAYDL